MPFIKKDTHRCDLPLPSNDFPDAKWYCPECRKLWVTYFLRPGIDWTDNKMLQSAWVWQWTGKRWDG